MSWFNRWVTGCGKSPNAKKYYLQSGPDIARIWPVMTNSGASSMPRAIGDYRTSLSHELAHGSHCMTCSRNRGAQLLYQLSTITSALSIATAANSCRAKDVSCRVLLFQLPCVGRVRSNDQVKTPYHSFVSPSTWVPPLPVYLPSYHFTPFARMPSSLHPCRIILPSRPSRPLTSKTNLAQSECGPKWPGYTSPSTSVLA